MVSTIENTESSASHVDDEMGREVPLAHEANQKPHATNHSSPPTTTTEMRDAVSCEMA